MGAQLISQYADDKTLFLCNDRSLTWALEVIERFALASGSKLNITKSSMKYFGAWRGRVDALGGMQVCTESLKLLGVYFDSQGSDKVNWKQGIKLKYKSRVMEDKDSHYQW